MASFKQSDLLGETPAPVQKQLLACTEFEVGMITGFAAGKTRGIIAAALQHGIEHPNAKILVGRKTYLEMVNTVKQPFFSIAERLHRGGWFARPANWDYREGTHVARLINGSQFFFSNLDDPIKFRNEEYSMVVVDQAEELREDLWEILIARIRHAAVPASAWQAIAAANDNGHNWVWRRFVDEPRRLALNPDRCTKHPFCVFLEGHPDEDGNPRPVLPCSTRRFFHGTTIDNKHNLSPRYLSTLLSHPKEWQKHFIYATMEGGAGRLLPDPRVVPFFEPPAHWPRYRAIDHALNSPCCCLWIAVNVDNGDVGGVAPNAPYVYREYWATSSSVDQHARRILDASVRETVLATVIDKSVYRLDQSGKEGVRRSIADLYAEEGLFTTPSVGDPFARVERINMAHNRGLAIADICEHTIRTMPEYYAEQSRTDGTFRILNRSEFHAIDALGYGLMVIPLDSREEMADGRPDYLLKPSSDPLTRRHHEGEWKRMKKVQETVLQREAGALAMVPSAPFWGDESDLEIAPYDPFSGEL